MQGVKFMVVFKKNLEDKLSVLIIYFLYVINAVTNK